MARLYWLALGTFAIGTEGFMIAPLLADLADDLAVSLVTAGQLVTVFALTYAFSSPLLTALTGAVDRRWLLIVSMLAFAAANFVACAAHSYSALMGARILLAVAAGLRSPTPMLWRAPSSSRRGGARRYQSSPEARASLSPWACLSAHSLATASAGG
jgi:predicted MFS family arabinose efflux permease